MIGLLDLQDLKRPWVPSTLLHCIVVISLYLLTMMETGKDQVTIDARIHHYQSELLVDRRRLRQSDDDWRN